MYAVIFEVKVKEEGKSQYLEIAKNLRKFLDSQEGFISIERFQSLVEEEKLLSLSFWKDLKSIESWKNNLEHQLAQEKGRDSLFQDYRIRIAKVEKDYTMDSSSFGK